MRERCDGALSSLIPHTPALWSNAGTGSWARPVGLQVLHGKSKHPWMTTCGTQQKRVVGRAAAWREHQQLGADWDPGGWRARQRVRAHEISAPRAPFLATAVAFSVAAGQGRHPRAPGGGWEVGAGCGPPDRHRRRQRRRRQGDHRLATTPHFLKKWVSSAWRYYYLGQNSNITALRMPHTSKH